MIDIFNDLGSLDSQTDPHVEEVYEELYELVGVRPVNYGFGFIEKGNPSTITFPEAMEAILNYSKKRDCLMVGDVVSFSSKDDWIEFGSKGTVTKNAKSDNYTTFYVKFETGNAAGREIECMDYNISKFKNHLFGV